MKILTKYVLKEHVGPLLYALCAATSLLLLNYIAKQLSNLAGKGLEWTIIAEFLILSVPFTLAMTLPMAVLLSTLYAFSRLASENEVSAMKANGIAMASLFKPVAIGSVIMALVMVAFNDQLLPRANHRLRTLQGDIARKKPTFALRENVLNPIQNRSLAIRTDRINRGKSMLYNVHIYDLSNPVTVRNIHADSGHIALTLDQRDLVLTLYSGYVINMESPKPGELNRVHFVINKLLVKGVGNELNRVEQNEFKGEREQSVCEMSEKYEEARTEFERSKIELRERMLLLVREAARGGSAMYVPPDSAPQIPQQSSWGSIYCTGVTAIGNRLSASADSTAGALSDEPVTDTATVDSAVASVPDVTPAATQEIPGASLSPGIVAQAIPPVVDPANSYAFMPVDQFAESIGSEITALSGTIDMQRRNMNRFAVEIHKKFALAGACIVFVLIGVPFALRFPRGGIGMVLAVGLVIFAVSYVGLIAGESLADRDSISPFLAMWGANILLALVGIALLLRMGRESTSREGGLSAVFENLRDRFGRLRGRQVT